jgi:hypothetical protein
MFADGEEWIFAVEILIDDIIPEQAPGKSIIRELSLAQYPQTDHASAAFFSSTPFIQDFRWTVHLLTPKIKPISPKLQSNHIHLEELRRRRAFGTFAIVFRRMTSSG